ncbi:MAG: SulP family inorganic anion transporter [Gammaproteobacteria bacterium]|nr:SulP family inorganic anion transporter [Gammaproteobacteria bacterium]
MKPSGFRIGDLWGGIAAVAIILPQAMAFGVALMATAGFSASAGAITGLIGTAAICLTSGFIGGTRGLISAPTGPMLVIQVAALTALHKSGLQGDALITGLMAVLLVMGIMQFLIGLSGGGRLIKFLPYPVVAGFITGSGVLMILSQVNPLSAEVSSMDWRPWYWLPIATAAVTYFSMSLVPKILPRIPGTVGGLVIGTLFFQVVAIFGPAAVPPEWVIGSLPSPTSLGVDLQLSTFVALPWKIIIPSALALAVLASIDTLLTAVVADVETKVRHVARKELIGQGVGQILAGFTGGMAGAGTTGATLVAIRSGGRRWAAVVAGVTIILLIFIGGPVGTILPISVLAGVILHVAVGMLDRDILAWLSRPLAIMDGVIAILVTTVTIAYDLMIAVGVGVLIAVIIFIRNEIRAQVVHRRSNASQFHSVNARTEEEREVLDYNAERIVMYELRGNLFFATADRLFEELSEDLGENVYLVLNMRRVSQIDLTAIKILQQIAERVHASGGHLSFCELHSGLGLGRKMHKALKNVSPNASRWKIRTFISADHAFAWAEDSLLREFGIKTMDHKQVIPLEQTDLCVGMGQDEIKVLKSVLKRQQIKKDEVVFCRGDFGDELYIVERGQIEIRLQTTEHHYKRLASYGPGTVFGEVAFFDPGQRVAEAVAVHKTVLLSLNHETMVDLYKDNSDVVLSLFSALGRRLSGNLRWSAREIKRLSQW